MTILAFARLVLARFPYRVPAVVGGMAAASLLEGLGIALLAPMFWLAGMQAPASAPTGVLGSLFQRAAETMGVTPSLTSILFALLGVFLLQSSVALLNERLIHRTRYEFAEGLRTRLYEALFAAKWEFLATQKTGTTVTALTQDAVRASAAVFNLFGLLRESITAAIYVTVALLFSWQMTLVVVSIGGLGMYLLRRRVGRGQELGGEITASYGALEAEAVDKLSCAKIVKAGGATRQAMSRFRGLARDLTRAQRHDAMNRSLVAAIYQPLTALMLLTGIYVAVTMFGIAFPDILVLLLVFFRLTPRISDIQVARHDLLSLLPSVAHIAYGIETAGAAAEPSGGRAADRLQREIAIQEVWFAYEGKEPVLRGITLRIGAGEMVALIGPSGCGKTTVADLCLGLLSPQQGTITVDGLPLSALDQTSWRRRAGYVPQDPVLFHDTIAENLRWGKPDATAEELRAAARLAHAAEFIEQLPAGYETVVGSRGLLLSGGQRQRLALARALIRNPDFLILDEATSSLDPESELLIQQTIEGLARRVSLLVVAHRLSTIQRADRIHVLEDGRIVETGTWQELTAAQGRLTRLRLLQTLT